MDDNTFKAIDRICDLTEVAMDREDWASVRILIQSLGDLLGRVNPNPKVTP